MSAHNKHITSINKLEWGAIQIAAAMRSNTGLLNDLIKLAEKKEWVPVERMLEIGLLKKQLNRPSACSINAEKHSQTCSNSLIKTV